MSKINLGVLTSLILPATSKWQPILVLAQMKTSLHVRASLNPSRQQVDVGIFFEPMTMRVLNLFLLDYDYELMEFDFHLVTANIN